MNGTFQVALVFLHGQRWPLVLPRSRWNGLRPAAHYAAPTHGEGRECLLELRAPCAGLLLLASGKHSPHQGRKTLSLEPKKLIFMALFVIFLLN